jgi:hypothetical protein
VAHTVLNETPIASAIAGCVIPLCRSKDALALCLRDFPPQSRFSIGGFASWCT